MHLHLHISYEAVYSKSNLTQIRFIIRIINAYFINKSKKKKCFNNKNPSRTAVSSIFWIVLYSELTVMIFTTQRIINQDLQTKNALINNYFLLYKLNINIYILTINVFKKNEQLYIFYVYPHIKCIYYKKHNYNCIFKFFLVRTYFLLFSI